MIEKLIQDESTAAFDSVLEVAPSVFLAFGSPMQAIDFDEFNESLTDFLSLIPYPRSIIMVSPFWTTDGKVKVTGSKYHDLIYDFDEYKDLPETLHLLTYPCAGNIDLAESVKKLLDSRGIETEIDDERGLDKGVWIPLYVAYPDMDVPVIQLSLPKNASPQLLYKMGETLSDLRKTGSMIITVGNLVHDKNRYDLKQKMAEPEIWAKEIDAWVSAELHNNNNSALFRMKTERPHPERVIDMDRFNPFFFFLGTYKKKDHIVDIFKKFFYGNTSMRSFAYVKTD